MKPSYLVAFPVVKFVPIVVLCISALFQQATEAQTMAGSTTSNIPIQPMTQVNVAQHLGYFGDPYPIHLATQPSPEASQYFSGTTQEILTCTSPIKPGCFAASTLTVTIADDLKATAAAAGNAFYDKINDNIYQTEDGEWQMAVTLYLHKQSNPKLDWTVIAHARPADPGSSTPPASWVADKILVGSLTAFDYANYDGKYFEDDKKLYLIYSKRLVTKPVEHDGIVAQEMDSPSDLASSGPVVLLAPSTAEDGFNSEFFHTVPPQGDTFKLIETGNITKISGKYVMAYSAGDYQQLDYKTGIAYSDTLLPEQGEMYRRIQEEDANGVWGAPGHLEVRYLLQSQREAWPNYVASQVIAPGVPSIVQEPSGRYFLYFDGFLPGDTPQAPHTPNNPLNIDPTHRRPFFVPLHVAVPSDQSVSAATEDELKNWITVSSR
jgi:hypothetical protein